MNALTITILAAGLGSLILGNFSLMDARSIRRKGGSSGLIKKYKKRGRQRLAIGTILVIMGLLYWLFDSDIIRY